MLNVDNTEELQLLSFCSGYGGIERGLELAGVKFRTVAHVEIEAYAIANLVAKMEEGKMAPAPIWSNLKTFPLEKFRDKIDIITGGYPCFTKGNLVLTRDGYKPIEDIRKGDYVLTHKGRWRKVLSLMQKPNAPTTKVIGQGFVSIESTNTHPFYTRKRYRKWNSDKRSYSRLFESPEWVYAEKLSKDTFVGQVQLREETIDRHSESFWFIVGRYLADGCRVQRNDRPVGSGHVVLTVGKHKTKEIFEEVKKEFGTLTEADERTVNRIQICRNDFYQFLEQFGKGPDGKHIPGWVFGIGKSKLSRLLDGYLSGDGNKSMSGWRANTVSEKLAYSIAYLFQCVTGRVAGIRLQQTENSKVIEGRTVNQRNYYVVDLPNKNKVAFQDNEYGWKQLKSIESTGCCKTVYNIEVDEDNSYTIGNVIVKNCQPFSVAGRRKGKDDPRHLWPYIEEAIEVIRPRTVFFENVEGHINLGLKEVIGSLEERGYETTWGIFSASEVGAPHQRKRVFILANSRSARPWNHIGSLAHKSWGEILRQENWTECPIRSDSTSSDEKIGLVDTESDGSSGGLRDVSETDAEVIESKEQHEEECGKSVDASDNETTELVDTDSQRERAGLGEISEENGEISKRNEDAKSEQSSEELADPKGSMQSGCDTRQGEVEFGGSGSLSRNGSQTRWPARPGKEQYDWEEPRVI